MYYKRKRWQATINSADASSATQIKEKQGVGTKLVVTKLLISTDTQLNFTIQDDAGSPNVLIQPLYLAANSTVPVRIPDETPLIVAENQDLDIKASGAGNVTVFATGYEISSGEPYSS